MNTRISLKTKMYLSSTMRVLTLFALVINAVAFPITSVQAETPIKVGLVTDESGVNDMAFNWIAYQGLLQAETDFGIEGTLYEFASGDDYFPLLQQCASNNDLCFGVGFLIADAIVSVANDYPDTSFAILDDYVDEGSPANLRGIQFDIKQVGYLAGALAGKLGNVVGVVGGMDIPPVTGFIEGYRNGAQCANENVDVLVEYAGTFVDPVLGAQIAQNMIDQGGANVIFGVAGPLGSDAILYSAQDGIWSIGVDTDQYLNVFGDGNVEGSDKLLTSAKKNLDYGVYQTIQDYINENFSSGTVTYTLADGGVGLAPYHETDAHLTQSTKDYVNNMRAGIIDGSIDINENCRDEPLYNPSFSVRLTEDQIHGYGWLLDSDVTLTIDEEVIDTKIATAADWDPNQTFVWFDLGDTLTLQAGQVIEMTDGNITKSHTVTYLVVDAVDVDANTVSGTAAPDTQVDIGPIYCDENGCFGFRRVFADHNTGEWLADFSVAGDDDDEQDIIDIKAGTGSEARQCDDDGDCTQYGWQVMNPTMTFFTGWNGFVTGGWPLNIPIQITVDDLDPLVSPDFTDTVDISENPDEPGSTRLIYDFPEAMTIQPRYTITLDNGQISKSLVVSSVQITDVGVENDIISGVVEPLANVTVIADNSGAERHVAADENGNWVVDFMIPGNDGGSTEMLHDIIPGDHFRAMVGDDDGDITFAEWQVPYPPRFGIQVGGPNPKIHSSGFLPNTTLTATVDNLETSETSDYTTTATTDSDGGAIFNLYYDVQPDDIVTLTDGVDTKSLIVRYLVITSVNAETDTISGTTDPFIKVHVWSPSSQNMPYMTVTSDVSGNWTANYSNIYDLAPGLDGFVETMVEDGGNTVEDGGNTMTQWSIPNPNITVFPVDEAVEAWEWPEGNTVHLVIDDPNTSQLPDFEQDRIATVTTWGDARTFVRFDFYNDYDLKAGDLVTVTDGSTLRSHVVLELSLTDINPSTDTITGMAEPGSTIVVWPHAYDQDATLEVDAGLHGVWVANFTGLFDLGIGMGGRSQILDEMGNATAVDWNVLSYTLHAVPAHPEVHGHDWAPGSNVTLIIDNDDDPNNGALYETTGNMDDDPWCGEPCFDLYDVFDLQVGQYVTITDGNVSKTVQVSMLTVTEVDYENDILRGSADEGSTVQVNIGSQDGISRTVQADGQDGTWMVDFSVPGNGDNEIVADIGPGDNGRAIQLNPDGTDDGTLEYWNIPNPFIQVRANDDRIEGYEWPEGATIIIEIDDPNPDNPDYSTQVAVGTAPWDPNQTYFELRLWDVFDIQPNFVVTASHGETIRQYTVVNLEFTNIDIDADIVTGTAAPERQIDIWACEFNNCFNINGVPVDAGGGWMADFQGIHDIQPGTWIDSIQYDEFGNGTMFGQTVEGAEIAGTIYAVENELVIEAGGVMVEACNTGQSVCRNALTDDFGNYTIAYLPKGEFNIKAYPAGDGLPGYSDIDNPINITYYTTYDAEDIVLPGLPPPPPTDAIEPSREGGGTISVFIGDPLTLTAYGCGGGTASFKLTVLDDGYIRTGSMTETANGVYTTTTPPLQPHHGAAEIIYTIECPGEEDPEVIPFFIYIDPSGVVKTVSGEPIAGATVTLLRADNPDGPFEVVPDGSVLMSPSNRTNPDTTDDHGKYGWDVLTGFYIVRAEFPGCYSPDDPSLLFAESEVLTIPPPVTDLVLILECPNNLSPVADAGEDQVVNEGGVVTLDGSGSFDPLGDVLTYAWDLNNDGEYDDASGVTTDVTYPDNGVFTYGLQVIDDGGLTAEDTVTITVQNVAPTIDSFTAPDGPVQLGAVVNISAEFSDPGTVDTFTATWNWEEGPTSEGVMTGYSVSGSHLYTVPGVYTVRLTITDDDGGLATYAHQYVVIYDPDGGFVTGGGWFIDPATGSKANFGFNPKYHTDGTLKGETEFKFNGIKFKSTSHDWMVIDDEKALVTGTGTVNGSGEYVILVSVIDGKITGDGVDKIRVIIWDDLTGETIYDSTPGEPEFGNPTMPIGGGSIVVHKAK